MTPLEIILTIYVVSLVNGFSFLFATSEMLDDIRDFGSEKIKWGVLIGNILVTIFIIVILPLIIIMIPLERIGFLK